jgi:hypothetical protein
MSPSSALGRCVFVMALLCFGGCSEDPGMEPSRTDPEPQSMEPPDPCQGRCSEVQLCVQDTEGHYDCAMICANQFHCWSGCCLPVGGTGYNVCRPTNYCFAP